MKKYIELIRTEDFINIKKLEGGGIGALYYLLIQSGNKPGIDRLRVWLKSNKENFGINDMLVDKLEDNLEIQSEFDLDDPDLSPYVISKKYFSEFLEKWLELIKTEHGVLKVTDDDGVISMELTEGDAEYNDPNAWKNDLLPKNK